MSRSSVWIRFLYGTVPGRSMLKVIHRCRLDRLVVWFLRSPWSRPLISRYARRNRVELRQSDIVSFRTFRDFFARKRPAADIDYTLEHLISPCDGWLSACPIEEDSSFSIKNSRYRLGDLLGDQSLSRNYHGGDCLIFRLTPSDYHHYCYIDDGFQGENHDIPGVLHSVQPIACEKYPVYVLNRRSWTLLVTEHFGPVVQTEIGALIVGGIYNERENARFRKGMEMGHFELAGSTIVLLFQKNRIRLRDEIAEAIRRGEEFRVRQGMWIGDSQRI